jgi:hypothetical protein
VPRLRWRRFYGLLSQIMGQLGGFGTELSVPFVMKPLVRKPVGGECLNLLAGIGRMPWQSRRYLTFPGTGHLRLLTRQKAGPLQAVAPAPNQRQPGPHQAVMAGPNETVLATHPRRPGTPNQSSCRRGSAQSPAHLSKAGCSWPPPPAVTTGHPRRKATIPNPLNHIRHHGAPCPRRLA